MSAAVRSRRSAAAGGAIERQGAAERREVVVAHHAGQGDQLGRQGRQVDHVVQRQRLGAVRAGGRHADDDAEHHLTAERRGHQAADAHLAELRRHQVVERLAEGARAHQREHGGVHARPSPAGPMRSEGRSARSSQAGLAAQQLGLVGALPGEVVVAAPEVAVGGRLAVDGPPQVEVADDGRRAQVEVRPDELLDDVQLDLLRALAVDHDGGGMRDADGVGDLQQAALGDAGGDDVLGHVAGRVGAGAVDLAGVLAAEGAAAVRRAAAVGVDDDLAAGEAGVAHGAADDELAGGVHERDLLEVLGVVEVLRQDRLDHVLQQVRLDQRVDVDAGGVLGGEDDVGDRHRPAVLVAHRDLRLAVRAQVGQHLGLADLAEPARQLVGQGDRQRHELRGLVAGEAEHHALVAGALRVEDVLVVDVRARLHGVRDALADVRRLLVDGDQHAAGLVVEAVLGVRVADVLDGLADDGGDVDVRLGGDLAGHDDGAGGQQGLAGDARVRIVLEDGVEDGV